MAALNERQKKFCKEYVFDFNGTRSYLEAYPNTAYNTARVQACKLLTKPNIQEYISQLQKETEKLANVSRLMVLEEYKKIAFSSIAHLHNTWVNRKEFDELTEAQKACIESIKTEEFHNESGSTTKVYVKLYDKQKALESITKMLGYNEPEKYDHTTNGESLKIKIGGKEFNI